MSYNIFNSSVVFTLLHLLGIFHPGLSFGITCAALLCLLSFVHHCFCCSGPGKVSKLHKVFRLQCGQQLAKTKTCKGCVNARAGAFSLTFLEKSCGFF